MSLDHAELLERAMAGINVPGRPYPRPLPAELAPWHCYIVDSGHCLACVPLCLWPQDALLAGPEVVLGGLLIPVPVQAVIAAGYQITEGFIVVDLPYDPDLGLEAPDGREEW